MLTSIRRGVFELGEQGRSRCRALLGSVVLHAVMLAGLVLMRPYAESSSTSTPGIVVVDLILLDDGDGTGGRVAEAEALAAEPEPAQGDAESPAPSELRTGTTIEIEQRVERAEPRPSLADLESLAEAPAPAGDDAPATATAETQPAAHEDPALASADSLPLEPTTMLREADLIASVPVPAPLPDFASFREPEVATLDAEEREMLDEKFTEWSRELENVSGDSVVWEHDGQIYNATFTRVAAADSMGIDHVLVSVSTEQDGSRWSTNMRMKRLAFSSFAQFVDRWDANVQIHDDEIDGRFHSNSEIYVSRSRGVQPTFRGKVTTARRVNTSNSERYVRRDEVFLGGLETRVHRIDLPQQFVALNAIDDVPPERVHRFDADTRIVFYVDGSFASQPITGGPPAERVMLSDEPHYLLGDEDVSLRVSGIVNGKVLVYAQDDIVIVGDLLYADHPRFDPESDDYAGLVADRNVVIAESRLTGQGDLTVHAAIFAKRRFLVRHFNSGGGYTLHVFGSLAAGSLSATEPRFRTRLEFDPRLEDARPPGFPVTDRYEVIEWDGAWTEELPGERG